MECPINPFNCCYTKGNHTALFSRNNYLHKELHGHVSSLRGVQPWVLLHNINPYEIYSKFHVSGYPWPKGHSSETGSDQNGMPHQSLQLPLCTIQREITQQQQCSVCNSYQRTTLAGINLPARDQSWGLFWLFYASTPAYSWLCPCACVTGSRMCALPDALPLIRHATRVRKYSSGRHTCLDRSKYKMILAVINK